MNIKDYYDMAMKVADEVLKDPMKGVSQILKTKLFGNRENHPRFEEFIGDYLAIAKSDLALYYNETESSYPLGQHAGMCEDELMIPVIVYPNTLKK